MPGSVSDPPPLSVIIEVKRFSFRFLRAALGHALLWALAFQSGYPASADAAFFDFQSTGPIQASVPEPPERLRGPAAGPLPQTEIEVPTVSALHAAQAGAKPVPPLLPDSAAADAPPTAPDTAGPRALREMQAKDAAHRDSLARARGDSAAAASREPAKDAETEPEPEPDTLVMGDADPDDADDLRTSRGVDEEEAKGWFVQFVADVSGDGGGGGWDGDKLAAVIYVVVGVVVVGAFLVYGLQTLAELAANTEHYPLFQEAGLRLSYSGKALDDPSGSAQLYRDAYLAGLRYAIGFDRPGMDLGLTVEGGYIDVRLRDLDDVARSFDFRGGYLVAGPMLRFGDHDPLSFSLEFLNGTSDHPSIGWISKTRMTLQARAGRHAVIGAHLGAVFYDLEFLDGLAWRRGDFNRDLSLISGLDFGFEF
jgi:hypothetical protein